jgi:hypothetical protein
MTGQGFWLIDALAVGVMGADAPRSKDPMRNKCFKLTP